MLLDAAGNARCDDLIDPRPAGVVVEVYDPKLPCECSKNKYGNEHPLMGGGITTFRTRPRPSRQRTSAQIAAHR